MTCTYCKGDLLPQWWLQLESAMPREHSEIGRFCHYGCLARWLEELD